MNDVLTIIIPNLSTPRRDCNEDHPNLQRTIDSLVLMNCYSDVSLYYKYLINMFNINVICIHLFVNSKSTL